jgi:eukaryotic-like serine/threonine-protein kinase
MTAHDRLASALSDRYLLERELGVGGSAAVFLARDLKHRRPVAIKVLHADLTRSLGAERFLREIETTANLRHPNILPLFDSGESEGSLYYVMPFIEGESLRHRLGREGRLSMDEALRFTTEIGDALSYAHGRGVIHRDIKPENILLDRDHAVVADFGIARALAAAGDERITATGTSLGTPLYMSPEQAFGEDGVDARSDLYSLACVLYEMLAGEAPFTGSTALAIVMRHLKDAPPVLDAARPETPVHVTAAISRALAKSPDDRFASVSEWINALMARAGAIAVASEDARPPSSTAPTASTLASIAVLPFVSVSADKEDEYFGDGLAEEIINALARVDGLKVIARTSAFSFKGKPVDVRHVAGMLGVAHVMEGSVRRSGGRIRVTAQLIAAADGTQVWSERFDRSMTDVFAMQDEIAEAITSALKGKLRGSGADTRHYTPDLAAYESFLRGRAHLVQFTPDAWHRARAYFEQAIRLDPNFADPHAELALGHFISGMHGMRPMLEVTPLVRAEVERALALDPRDQRPRFLLGAAALVQDFDWATADSHFAASMSAKDVSPYARWIYASLFLRGYARFDESSDEMARAVEQDPLNATWHAILAAHLIDTSRRDQAVPAATRATELEPDYFIAQHLLGEALWANGRKAEAVPRFERAQRQAPWNAVAVGWRAVTLWQLGEHTMAEDLMSALGDAPMPLWGRVLYHLHTGDLEAAANWYQRMIDHRDPFCLVYAMGDATRPLREHARWARLREQMNLPETGAE